MPMNLPLVLSTVLAAASVATARPVTVKTSLGSVLGSSYREVDSFFGIPFAADTSGKNRFRPPQPRAPWTGVRNATKPASECRQGGSSGSEDCLIINAFAPARASTAKLYPIYFFIHGGAFEEGSATSGGLYDGSTLARNESICVFAVQYRLGFLGFMTAAARGIGGNFGLQDQRAGMKWVLANAAAFGCDASRVTIGGESAGAESVTAHLASPLSKGLFQRAIAESNLGGMLYRNASDASTIGEAVVRHSGCGSGKGDAATCLRAMPLKDLEAAAGAAMADLRTVLSDFSKVWGHLMTIIYFWSPTTYTTDLPVPVQEAFNTGAVAGVPWIVGSNENEGDMFVPAIPFFKGMSGFEYSQFLKLVFPDVATRKAVLQHPDYKAPGLLDDASYVFSRLLTDYWFRCGDLKLAHDNAALADTWTYRFRHPMTPKEARVFGMPPICGNTSTCHAGELPYVFGNPVLPSGFSKAEQSISETMVKYWGAFVRGEKLDGWAPSTSQSMQLGDGTQRMAPVPEICKFWDEIGYIIPKIRMEAPTVVV